MEPTKTINGMVVNCFQIVSLSYWTQLFLKGCMISLCCELLSNCIFELLDTTLREPFGTVSCCELLSNCIFELLDGYFGDIDPPFRSY